MDQQKLTSYYITCTVCKSHKGPMFRFPKDLARRESWRLFFGLESATDYMRICSSHFHAEDIKKGNSRSRLVRHAVPRIKIPECVERTSRGRTRKAAKPKCIVPVCGNFKDDRSLHVTRVYGRRCQWATPINLDKIPSRHSFICGNHLVPSNFHTTGAQRSLTSCATPSVNLGVCERTGDESQKMKVDWEDDTNTLGNSEVLMLDEEEINPVLSENPNNDRLVSSNQVVNGEEESSEDQHLHEARRFGDVLLPSSLKEFQAVSVPLAVETCVKVEAGESQSLKEQSSSANDADMPLSGFKSLSSKLLADISDIINAPSVSHKPCVNIQAVNSSDEEEVSSPPEPKEMSSPPEPCEFDKLETNGQLEAQLKSFTNVTNLTFNYLLKLVLEVYREDDARFSMKKKIFLTLSKLFLNHSYDCLSVLVGFPRRMCGAYFADTLHILAGALKNSVTWPSKEEITLNMPKCFEKLSDTRVILSCIEVPLTSRDCSKYPIRLHVPSKGSQSIKILVGYAPSGLVIFVSEVYGGLASDKDIIEDCDLLSKLEPHVDAVVVDRSFAIHDVCRNKEIKVYTSPCALKKQPLTESNTMENSETSAWAHVQNVIDRIGAFKVLHSKLSGSFVPHLDDLLVVIAGLVNLSPPFLADNELMVMNREDSKNENIYCHKVQTS